MENEFITYEQSLALKEIGYVDYSWFGSECSLYKPNGKHTFYMNGVGDETYISAPLKQQVFRWFRENYELIYFIGDDFGGWSYSVSKNSKIQGSISNVYKTYEETESGCINKLIEIVKKK